MASSTPQFNGASPHETTGPTPQHSTPAYVDVTNPGGEADTENQEIQHGHNASPQCNVEPNSDLALHLSREHHHQHLHHNQISERGRKDEVVYSQGTTFEKSNIPDPDPQDHEMHRRHHAEKNDLTVQDAEKGNLNPVPGEEDPQTHTLSRYYVHFRIGVHLFIWLLFTGYVPVYCLAPTFSFYHHSLPPKHHDILPLPCLAHVNRAGLITLLVGGSLGLYFTGTILVGSYHFSYGSL